MKKMELNKRNSKARSGNTSGFKGVSTQRGRWIAMININGKNTCLGSFKTKKEAAQAYDSAVIEHYGEL